MNLLGSSECGYDELDGILCEVKLLDWLVIR
jgi:hypothetical protein